jgi:hypothetical protein
MEAATSGLSCYLVEWYRDGLPQDAIDQSFAVLTRGARLASDDGACAEVMLMLSVPTDDLMFCVFSATSPEVVVAACNRAGLPPERVTPAMVAA